MFSRSPSFSLQEESYICQILTTQILDIKCSEISRIKMDNYNLLEAWVSWAIISTSVDNPGDKECRPPDHPALLPPYCLLDVGLSSSVLVEQGHLADNGWWQPAYLERHLSRVRKVGGPMRRSRGRRRRPTGRRSVCSRLGKQTGWFHLRKRRGREGATGQVNTQPTSCPDFRQALRGAHMESCKGKEPKIVVAIYFLHWKDTQET